MRTSLRLAKWVGTAVAGGAALAVFGAASAQSGALQPVDYEPLERPAETAGPDWPTLLDEAIGENGAESAADRHAKREYASRTALVLPTNEEEDTALLILPKDNAFAAAAARGEACLVRIDDAAARTGAAFAAGRGASFALRRDPSICAQNGLSIAAVSHADAQDVELRVSPGVSNCSDGNCTLRSVKGEVRLGEISRSDDQDGWYVYGAADGTVVVWNERPSAMSDIENAVDVRDSLTMGDVEAGIMLNRGTADIAINYVHRTSKFQNWEDRVVDSADYVGIKLTID